MKKIDVARKYRAIYGMEMPSRALAKIICDKEPQLFFSLELARTTLRAIENKSGKLIKNQSNQMPFPERPKNPYNLPKSYEEKREPFILPVGCNNILLLSDLHIPYHNIDALSLAIEYGIEQKVNTIFLNGDVIDCATVSKFEPDLKKRSIKEEFDLTKDFLKQLRFCFPEASIYWLKGNHCYAEGTEVLTEGGFVDFRELNENDLVAQFDSGMNITYAKPICILKREYKGSIYDIETGFSRQVVTDGHDVVVGNSKVKAKDLSIKDLLKIPSTGNLKLQEYPLSDLMLRFLVNVVTDGCFVLDKNYGFNKMHIQFKLSKDRKISNLTHILEKLGFNYTLKECKKTQLNILQPYYIRIYGQQAKEIFELLDCKKNFPAFFRQLSNRQAEIIIDELMVTDGTQKDNGIFWTTTSKQDVDTIQEMCILNNLYFVNYGQFINKTDFDNAKTKYKVKIRKTESLNVLKSIKVSDYDGFVYCLEMPLQTIITRYGGKTAFSGNCIRWEKFLMAKVHQIWDDPYFHLEERLSLNEFKVQILDDSVLVKAGKLAITHGHHIFKGVFVPVSPARGAYMRSKQNVIVGHLHRPSYHPETDMEGNIVAAWSTGCLCELRPKYSPLISNSQHGFAHIIVQKDGNFTVYNKTIINGEIH